MKEHKQISASDYVVTNDFSNVSLDEVIESSNNKEYETFDQPYFGVLTTVLYFDIEQKSFFISHPFNSEYVIPVEKTLVAITPKDASSEVLVSFDRGNIAFPVITGKVQSLSITPEAFDLQLDTSAEISTNMDSKEKLLFKADKEIVFQCGKSSITLTKAGKVLIRGAYVLSRSSGVNKIKGGSVQLN